MTYILLTRALKNVGDFLIFETAKKLINRYKRKHDLLELEAWKPLDIHLKVINKSDAVIICGGPGIRPDFHPGIYPLTKRLEDISAPVILFGSGWYGFPGDDATIKNFKFTSASVEALRKIHRDSSFISCRDYLTKRVLVDNGFTKVLMTGCPSWYDLETIDQPIQAPNRIEKVAFTPAQGAIYHRQTLRVMKVLEELFGSQELFCSFHRGWGVDKFTSRKEADRLAVIRSQAIDLGYKVVNMAYDISNMSLYKECDLHVGYRLHAHTYFLRQRKPSFLLEEDGRGRGFSEAVGLLGIRAWQRRFACFGSQLMERLEMHNNLPFLEETIQSLRVKASSLAVEDLETYIQEEIHSQFARFVGLDRVFQRHFETMKRFLDSLP